MKPNFELKVKTVENKNPTSTSYATELVITTHAGHEDVLLTSGGCSGSASQSLAYLRQHLDHVKHSIALAMDEIDRMLGDKK